MLLEQLLGARLREAERVRVIRFQRREVEREVEPGEVRRLDLRTFGEEAIHDPAPVEQLETSRIQIERPHERGPIELSLEHHDAHAAHRELGGE
jgi:hypothetical protein